MTGWYQNLSLYSKISSLQNKAIIINSLLVFVGVLGLIALSNEDLKVLGYVILLATVLLYAYTRLKFGFKNASFLSDIVSNIFFGGKENPKIRRGISIGAIVDLIAVIIVLVMFFILRSYLW
jgi:hypothetical protein